jgi:MFS transporter, ACS family, hexuronate transporter
MNNRPRYYQGLLVGLLCLNFGILFFDRNALNFLMPFVQPDLGFSNTEVGLLASAFSLTWAIAGIVVGGLSDRTGMRKPILIVVTLVFAVCSALSGLVTSFLMLFAVRLLMGIAEGGVLPVSQALTVIEVSPERRGFAMGFMQNFGSNLLGSTAASMILVPFATHFGWRKAFFLAAIPGIVSALLVWWLVREPPREAKVAGVIAERLTLAEALTNRNILLCVLISILLVSHLVIGFVFLPLFLVNVRGLPPETMGALIGTLGVSAAIAGFVAPGMSDWVGRKPTMIVVCFAGVILPFAALFFHGTVWALGAVFFAGWTVVGAFPLFMATIPSETVDSRHTATALGLIMGVGEGVGGAISPTLAGMAADRYGLNAPLWIMLCLPIAAGLLSVGLRETAPRCIAAMAQARG